MKLPRSLGRAFLAQRKVGESNSHPIRVSEQLCPRMNELLSLVHFPKGKDIDEYESPPLSLRTTSTGERPFGHTTVALYSRVSYVRLYSSGDDIDNIDSKRFNFQSA
ncbi:hypothetical protein RHMOL_Rhmol10G0234400 [Rhododendron molle]|uniref:Uncharacterized protein n=1 Tax=Rhododendron molle TaxID=49168 RepID=A0ACC0M6F2_RHOML|nr:hypothetical protein RHMOL_Rhmol10G0234400 [Rhododendron molle]